MQKTTEPWVVVLAGPAIPKPNDLLQRALDRARRLTPAAQVLIVVPESPRAWWETALASVDQGNVIVEPRDRGTAAGVLLALVHVLKRDHAATIVVLPSNHSIEDEEALLPALEQAVAAVHLDPDYLVLVVDRPAPVGASEPARSGPGWTTLLFAAAGRTLLFCYGELPELLEPFLRDLVVLPHENGLADLYKEVPARDFSRDLLARAPDRIRTLTLRPCG